MDVDKRVVEDDRLKVGPLVSAAKKKGEKKGKRKRASEEISSTTSPDIALVMDRSFIHNSKIGFMERLEEASSFFQPDKETNTGLTSFQAAQLLAAFLAAFLALNELQSSAILGMPEEDLIKGLQELAPKKHKEFETGLSPDRKCTCHDSSPLAHLSVQSIPSSLN